MTFEEAIRAFVVCVVLFGITCLVVESVSRLGKAARRAYRNRKSNRNQIPLLESLLEETARDTTGELVDLLEYVDDLSGPPRITVTTKQGDMLEARHAYAACLIEGLDHLIRFTNVSPHTIDKLVQVSMSRALQRMNDKAKG